ncbi:MAG: 4Fe-4S dicluster domain-containing protein [Acidobacteria bacterium]|nr:4Fe-4S dicluster domain-containing protein [Acidobacteriota bacterium]
MSDDAPSKKAKGTVFVRKEICKGCSYCIDFCPPHCLAFSDDYNAKGYHYPVLSPAEDCTGCDLCGLYCPDFAIFGVKYEDIEKLRQDAATPVRVSA